MIIYLNDILIYSETIEKFTLMVEKILKRLRKKNLQVNLTKSSFNQDEMEFVEFLVSKSGLQMLETIIEAVQAWFQPQKVKNIQEFLGFVNFY